MFWKKLEKQKTKTERVSRNAFPSSKKWGDLCARPNILRSLIFFLDRARRTTPLSMTFIFFLFSAPLSRGNPLCRPQFFVRTADITGSVQLPAGTEMVMPGDTVSLTIDVSTRGWVLQTSRLFFPLRDVAATAVLVCICFSLGKERVMVVCLSCGHGLDPRDGLMWEQQ